MTAMPVSPLRARSTGVTLVELAITIALVGILAALIVQFVAPVRSYIDSSRRAALADTADTALRRIGRDLRLALPNSARVDPTGKYVEFMLIRTGGRYRADKGGGPHPCGNANKDVLDIGKKDDCFTTIGNLPNLAAVLLSDFVAIFNLQPGTPNADVYEYEPPRPDNKGNTSKISALPVAGAGEDRISIDNHDFTYDSPGNRFFIVEGPVSYGCDLATGRLTRYWGYTGFAAGQQTPPAGGSSALIARGVTACDIVYDVTVAAGTGLITIKLQLTMQDSRGDSESVSLYHAIHVNNVP